MRRAAHLAVAVACLVWAAGLARAAEGPLEKAGGDWLELLDEGRFDDAWREGADLLRSGVTQAEWTAAMRRLREGLGEVKSREAVTKDYHQQLEGAPDGTYFTLRFRTRLADGRELVEVVTLTPGADQRYRTAAYALKR